mgnify:FL=1
MKKNVLFIVIDSVTNDILFNKNTSSLCAPFLNELRKKSISGDKMFSEAPYTEAALMCLLGGIDTMDNGGYMERFKDKTCVLEVFRNNGYKVFHNNYYPSIYPSYMAPGYDERKYIEGFQFSHIWDYRLKYYSEIFEKNEIRNKCYHKDFQQAENNSKFNHKKLKFEPKIIFGKILVSLVTAISILGCGQTVKAEGKSQEIVTVDQIQSQIELNEKDIEINQENSSDEVVTIQKLAPNEYKLLTGNCGSDLYFDSVEEFSKQLGKNKPTYAEIEKKIQQNSSIPDKYKTVFIEGLENLKVTMPDLNLSVLDEHLKRGLKVVEKTGKEISEQEGPNSIAAFDKANSIIFINPENVNEETLLHELAHAITGIIMQKDGKKIYMGTEAIIYFKDTGNLQVYGTGFAEAIADIVSKNALGDKGIEKGSYQAISEQLEVMLNVTHDSPTDLVNKGTSRFIQKAKKIGIDTIYDNISSCDMLCTALQEGISIQTKLSVKQNLYNFLIKYAMKQLEQGISKERIIKNIDNAIFNTTYSNVVVFEGGKAIEIFEMIDLRNEIVEEIQNKNVKIKEERD